MRCCKCKSPKEPWVLVCRCCGGTTYEGYYKEEEPMVIYSVEYGILRKIGFSRAESIVFLFGDILRKCDDLSWTTKSIIDKIQFEERRISDCIDSIDKKLYQIKLECLEVMFMAHLEEDMKIVEEKYGFDIVGAVK